MLSDFTPSATADVKNLEAVRSFYEGILGFEPIGSTQRAAQAVKVRGATVLIYESQLGGTNQATAMTWNLGEHFDETVKSLDAEGYRSDTTNCRVSSSKAMCMWCGTAAKPRRLV